MTISKIEAWRDSKGGVHVTERAALANEVLIVTGFKMSDADTVIANADKLVPLLQRIIDMAAEAAAPTKPPALPESDGRPAAETAVDPSDMTPDQVRDLLKTTMIQHPDKAAIRQTIESAGYRDLLELLDRASDEHVRALLAKVVRSQVSGRVLDAQGHAVNCKSRATGYEADCHCGVLDKHRD